jgi:hypothetical protein
LEELKKCLLIVDNNTDLNANENAANKRSEEDRRSIMNVLGLRDSSGLTPLLFAADRGLVEVSAHQMFLAVCTYSTHKLTQLTCLDGEF